MFSSWPIRIFLCALFLIGVGVAVAWINAGNSRNQPVAEDLAAKPNARELVVLVHNYTGSNETMRPVKEAVEAVRPDADIVRFGFPAQVFSRADLFSVSAQIESKIDDLWRKNSYERITLCGYSIGALLVRKAYVYGCGKIEDAPWSDGRQNVSRPPKEWVSHVDRFVLLAGMNRGWSREARLASLGKKLAAELGVALGRLSGTGTVIRQAERGEPFVANLRLQWLDVMHSLPPDARPRVIQLLGERDDVVEPEDSKDVNVSRDFIWVPVSNTRHGDMAQLGDAGSALERKQKVQEAFGDAAAVERLKRFSQVTDVAEDPNVECVVFVLHGIRDMGHWTSDFEKPLQASYLAKHPDGKSKLHVHRAQYGYFGMGPFLLWADRQKNVRWFMDQVTELKAQFPNLKELNFIGHSNGTYVLASALGKYATLRINHAVLAGSVVRRDYPWSWFTGRIKQVRNYVGSADWVVGLCPCVFEKPGFNLLNEDIGSAGFNGFTDPFPQPFETRFIEGAHSAALCPDNISSIVDFIINGQRSDEAKLHAAGHPGWLDFLSNVCWALWIGAAGLLVLGWFKAPAISSRVTRWFSPRAPSPPRIPSWVSRTVYVVVILLILNTV